MSQEQNIDHASRITHHVADLYFIFQHEKLGTFKAAQKLQELYRAGELPNGLGDVARLLLTFDQRRALRYTARERLTAYRKVLGYSLHLRPARGGEDQRNRAFHRLLVGLAGATAQGSGRAGQAAGALLDNLTPMTSWDMAPLCEELLVPLNSALRIFMSPELCAVFGAESGWALVETVLRRHFDEQEPRVLARSRLAEAGRILLRDLDATPAEVARLWLESAAQLDVLPATRETRPA